MSRRQSSLSWQRYPLAIAFVAAASLFYLMAAPPEIDSDVSHFGLSAAVLLSSTLAGFGPGLLATVLGACVSAYLFIPSAIVPHIAIGERTAWVIVFVSQGILLAFIGDLIHNARTEDVDVPWAMRYVRAFLLVAGATAVKLAVLRTVATEMPFVFYYATTAASAWLGGFGPGVLATLMAALCARFFFIDPLYSFSVMSTMAAMRVALFIAEGIALSAISGKAITARHVANRALHRMRQYGELLLQSTVRARALRSLSRDVVWEWDLPRSITIQDDGGIDAETGSAATFSSWLSGIHPRDRLKVLESLKTAVQEGVAEWGEEYRRLLPGKGYVHVSDHAFILRDSAHHPVRVVGRSVESLEAKAPPAGFEAEGPYRALFENNPYAMLLTDRGLKIVDANNAACDVLGYSRTALTHRGLDELLSRSASGMILGLKPEDSFSITFEEDCVRGTGEVFRAKITAAMISGIEQTSADRVITIEETAEA